MNIIETKVTPTKLIFNKGDFYIYSCESKDTQIEKNKFNNFSIKGTIQRLSLNTEYIATLEPNEPHPQYGMSYNCISIYQDIPQTKEDQRAFFSYFLTENQVDEIFKVYGDQDIIQLIIEDKFDYTKVKGFGHSTYQRIREKVLENVQHKELLSKLGKYGITFGIVMKLADKYKSPELVIQKLEENPYILTEVSGIGFKKADIIAMNMGISTDNPFRIRSGIVYTLEANQDEGHTYMLYDKLIKAAIEILGVHDELIKEQIFKTDKIIITDDDKVSIKKTFETEQYIAQKLHNLMQNKEQLKFDPNDFISRMEEKYKFKLTHQQRDFFHNLKRNAVNVLTGYAGCVDMDTEYFNGKEWKKISEYVYGEKVLQYNEDRTASLVDPIMYHKLPEENMTLIVNKSGSLNQCLSQEHTVVYETCKGYLAKLPFCEVERRNEVNGAGFNGRFLTTFGYNEGTGIDLSDDQIRLMIAVIADGHFASKNTNLVRINLKKARKKERLLDIIVRLGLDCRIKNRDDGYSEYRFDAPIRIKKFDYVWYNCTNEQLKIICDEILHWDGSVNQEKGQMRFSSAEKETIDFIQFAFASQGHRATIRIDDRVGQTYKDNGKYVRNSIIYDMSITQNKDSKVSLIARTPDKRTKFEKVKTIDGHKYCFTVPSGMWVMRRNGRICVTGNCGKSFIQKLVVELLDELKLSYILLSPTAKAAKVIKGYTGIDAKTIHRAIGYGQDEKKIKKGMYDINADVILIDETSMVDVFLQAMLLSRIKNPKARILFSGDSFQLQSVQAGVLFHDMIESGVLPVTKFDIVFRQSEGGLLDFATKIRQGERLVDYNFSGMKKFGKDLILHCVEQQHIEDGYKHYYKRLLKMYDPKDIMVLSPTKKGKLGTVDINKFIQSLVNEKSAEKQEYEYGENMLLREDDYVMNIKNTYDIFNVDEDITDIINGDSGTIIEIVTEGEKRERIIEDSEGNEKSVMIDSKGITIEFDNDTVTIPFKDAGQLMHSWCITGHKSQGSSSKAVLIVLDKAHRSTANLIYTMVTRTIENCIVLTQAETLNFAMKKIENLRRQTRLQDFLVNEFK